MTNETKMALFEETLRMERLAQKTAYDGRNYWEQSNGAFAMLQILGLDKDYIEWSTDILFSDGK